MAKVWLGFRGLRLLPVPILCIANRQVASWLHQKQIQVVPTAVWTDFLCVLFFLGFLLPCRLAGISMKALSSCVWKSVCEMTSQQTEGMRWDEVEWGCQQNAKHILTVPSMLVFLIHTRAPTPTCTHTTHSLSGAQKDRAAEEYVWGEKRFQRWMQEEWWSEHGGIMYSAQASRTFGYLICSTAPSSGQIHGVQVD